ncbi:hypothetical protein GCM10022287_28990 [Gryllotalpicola koreensis]|uniref:Uncharacterized protein n=1 Tax=Gryllotalpicola koreensis TaxID=993086 RepID=A0ABP8A607_9MICO
MSRPEPLPEHLASGPFTVSEADAAPLTRGRLRSSDLAAPFKGIRLPRALLENAEPDKQLTLLCDAYQKQMPRNWFFSGPTAARIMGVPLPSRLENVEVHVTAVGAFAPRGRYVIGHTTRSAETSWFERKRVRVPHQVFCELASVLELDELIAAGDRMLCDKPYLLATRRHLEGAVAAHDSGRGAEAARGAAAAQRGCLVPARDLGTAGPPAGRDAGARAQSPDLRTRRQARRDRRPCLREAEDRHRVRG